MNPREKFEKETGWKATDWNMDSTIFHPKYIEWLEQRNAEMVEALERIVDQNPEDLPGETMLKIEQVLKNNGVEI